MTTGLNTLKIKIIKKRKEKKVETNKQTKLHRITKAQCKGRGL